MTTQSGLDPRRWTRLRKKIEGDLLQPGEAEYELYRRPVGRRFHDVHPAILIRPAHVGDVACVLAFAAAERQRIAVRSGGHDFAGRSTDPGVVLDLARLDGIAAHGSTVTVGPGARLGPVYDRLALDGWTLPAGCGASVGIGGLALGGGLGVLGRLHGLLCDHLIAAEVVTADGSVVRCDESREQDLLWALRGGGAAGVGVVTKFTFAAVPAPACTVYEWTWQWEHAGSVADAWQRWAPGAAAAVAASLLLEAPADPELAPTVTVLGSAADLDLHETEQLLHEFACATGAAPATRRQWRRPWIDTKTALADLAPGDDDGHLFIKSEFFRDPIPPQERQQLLDLFIQDRRPGEARELDFTPWGAAYNRTPVGATAFPHRQERFLLKHGATLKPEVLGRLSPPTWLTESWTAVHASGSGGVYPNFPDDTLPEPEDAYWRSNIDRLASIRSDLDPDGLLRPAAAGRRRPGPHSVPPHVATAPIGTP